MIEMIRGIKSVISFEFPLCVLELHVPFRFILLFTGIVIDRI